MKKILLCAAFIAVSFTSIAQVGIGTTTPDASAVLDISSNEKGLLIPRMTTAQRDAIAAVEGLMVYVLRDDDDDAGSFMYYDGNTWKELFRGGLTTPRIISGGEGKDDLYENSGEQQVVYTILVNNAITGEITYILEGMGDTSTALLRLHETNKNEVILIPDPNFEVQEKYNFRVKAVSRQGEESLWKAVSFSILPIDEPPVAIDDAKTIINNETLGTTKINVITNDEAVDYGDKLTLSEIHYEGDGTVTVGINEDKDSVIYTPALNFNGTETIRYTVSDGTLTDEGSLEITVVHIVKSTVTNKIWMDRNLGAEIIGNNSADSRSFGFLYQGGRDTDGHQERNSQISEKGLVTIEDAVENGIFILADMKNEAGKDWLEDRDDKRWWGPGKGIHDPCPTEFRLPTNEEFEAEFKDNSNQQVWDNLKIPYAGYRNMVTGDVGLKAADGKLLARYWTNTPKDRLYRTINWAEGGVMTPYQGYRSMGHSVRCIKQLPGENSDNEN